ncbi:hypothetical protein EFP35_04860 [Lactiplantibacillus pentosus]|nr:hypothetical protein [Lactiplantibacillus pentosus]
MVGRKLNCFYGIIKSAEIYNYRSLASKINFIIVSLSTQNDIATLKTAQADATENQGLDTSLDDVRMAQVQPLKDESVRGLIVRNFFTRKGVGLI